MNIFFLDPDVRECAQAHVDKHVVKMILEYAQLLSTAHRVLDEQLSVESDSLLYKTTHKNHPCAVWVRENSENYRYLHSLLVALCEEYSFRYERVHATQSKGIVDALEILPKNIIICEEMTPAPKCVADDCIRDDLYESYREYYRTHKAHILSWKNRPEPVWV